MKGVLVYQTNWLSLFGRAVTTVTDCSCFMNRDLNVFKIKWSHSNEGASLCVLLAIGVTSCT